jgi:hypothetical protein
MSMVASPRLVRPGAPLLFPGDCVTLIFMSADAWSLIARAAMMIGAMMIGLPVRGHNPHIRVWS